MEKDFVKMYLKLVFIREHKFKKNKKILKDYNISNILYRSSGPTILTLYRINKILKLKRISLELSRCIYSKSYFNNFLKKNNLPYIQIMNEKVFKLTLRNLSLSLTVL